MKPDIELLRQWFEYVPEIGGLRRLRCQRNGTPEILNPERNRVDFLGVRYRVTHIIWALHHGIWPEIIDHIDHDKQNNKIENLREATINQNMWNRQERNPLGKGVTMKAGKYHAQIQCNGIKKHLGDYLTAEEAAAAYAKASKELHGEFSCLE